MKSCRYPISHSLTSFNGVEKDTNTAPDKPVAKVHHLPASIWKKKDGEAKNALDVAI